MFLSEFLFYLFTPNLKQKGLGVHFVGQVREKVGLIRLTPKVATVRYDNVRTIILDMFPYMIHYVVDDLQKTIIISALFHTSRDPEIWKDRNE